jgi:thioredoxin-related protein
MNHKIISLFFLIFSSIIVCAAQNELRQVKNEAFLPGEILKFRIHYGIVDAGEATIEVKKDLKNFGGRECYHFIGIGKSVGAFDWFFKVRDRYESIVDKEALIPWFFIRRVNEGGYIINQNVTFNHFNDSAKSEKATISVPDNCQDLVSAFYFARTLDFTGAKEGDIFEISGYLDDAIFPMNVKFVGRENIKSKKGTFRCLKLRPMLQEGRVFKDQEDMTIWVSDDKNKIPVRVQTEIAVGSIKMDLVDYENLANTPAIE